MRMPSGLRTVEGRAWIFVATWLALSLGAGPAVALDLEVLLESLALDERQEVVFEESRFIETVTTPIVSRGRFIFEPPDRLIKTIEHPRRESAVLEDDRLAILDAEGTEIASVDLWLQPDLRLIFASIRGVLKGDPEVLRSVFWVSLQGDLEAWSLELSPKVDEAKTRIQRIDIAGDTAGARTFEIMETSGRRSQIRLLHDTSAP